MNFHLRPRRKHNEYVKVRTEYSSASFPSVAPLPTLLAVLNKVVKKCHSAVNITGCPYGWKLENEEAKNRSFFCILKTKVNRDGAKHSRQSWDAGVENFTRVAVHFDKML